MKIIDFEKKGNLVRFYLGKDNCNDYWGADWDDISYEFNAERVEPCYVQAHIDVVFPFDYLVLEPADVEDVENDESGFCMDDMKNRLVPCIIIVPPKLRKKSVDKDFKNWVGAYGVHRIYFEDDVDVQFKDLMPLQNRDKIYTTGVIYD